MREQIDPSTGLTGVNRTGWGDPSTQGCAAFDTGECAVDVPFPADHRFRVTLRMRDTASMYLNGAVDEPGAGECAATGDQLSTAQGGGQIKAAEQAFHVGAGWHFHKGDAVIAQQCAQSARQARLPCAC